MTSQKQQRHETQHLRGEYDVKFGGPTAVAGQTLSAVQTVGDAITPFVPLFNMVTNILTQMLSIYENAKCNEKICLALLDRVEIAQTAVKSLQRKYQANEKNFRDQVYYDAWIRFVNVLENIRKFSKEVTQLNYFQKFMNANAVKDAFEKNIKEFEEVCSDLNFTMAMYNAEQREMEAKNVAEDLEILKKSMNEMKDEIKAEIRLAITEVTTLMSSANHLGSQLQLAQQKGGEIPVVDKTAHLIDEYKAPKVDPRELTEPFASNDNVRGSKKTVHKKIFRGIEVACKKVQISKPGESGQLKSPDQTVERANYKIQQLELAALLKLGVTDRFEPKISNFELSRSITGVSSEIKTLADIIRWLAPEKMRKPPKSQQQRYNHQCEMYRGKYNLSLQFTFVIYICFKLSILITHLKFMQKLIVIYQAWEDEPSARPSDIEMQQKLKDLFNEHVFSRGISPQIHPKKTNSGDIPSFELPKSFEEKVCITDSQQSCDQFETPDECDDALNEMTIQEIIKYMTMAADHENPTALFNLGDIYWNGKLGVPVDKVKAEQYIKLAALKGQQKAAVMQYGS
ncbi:20884_t:CDS:2 [Cetraspora pellucida]|uniref:20884_t:CDS:1 n=1 Tax=Cetraspora pellucida TaxID=1433469 RepID=A0A9N9AP07_9GLOM|nr:20884_t:CDS:2 [Cetraspora pellucida]